MKKQPVIEIDLLGKISYKDRKNLKDSEKLFDLVRTDLLNKKKTNFLFVKDITTHQRKLLYNLLESKGYNRRKLFKHYSY